MSKGMSIGMSSGMGMGMVDVELMIMLFGVGKLGIELDG